ncbi:MAG: TonB-dependent receptor [Candidatus Omnitrophica bacterium]|nr:TonB-dependent receptor [Candidatus Omnitrophota bacterium]MCG2706245.1 TonB-dependent receptor [Candidatus Omnitrophota bacterium]
MKRFNAAISILGLLGLVLSGKTFAQDIDLERIVVMPSRIEESYSEVSRNIDVITSKDIEMSGAKDLAGVLTEITSVNISNYGGLGATKTIRMRGSTASQVLVLVDGRPINNPRDGQAELSNILLENIDRIEVMHGPGSSLYGAGAMGGTVNIITKKPPKEKQKTEFTTSFGTSRIYIERLSHGGRISRLGYLINTEYESSQGFRDNSEFSAKNFNAKLEYEFNNDNNLILNSGFYRSKLGTPGKITEFDIDDKQGSRKNFIDLNWDFKPDNTTGLSAKIYQNYDRLEFTENTTTTASDGDTAFNKDIHTTKARGIDFQISKQLFDNYQGVCGFNYVANLNDSTASAKHKYIVRAGYLENQLNLFKDLKITFGARLDDYSNFGTEFNPSFSFLYNFSQDFKIHGLISRSFRAPTFNDLYYPDVGWAVGNPNVNPEKGITGELGIKTKINKYILSDFTYYRSDYDNLINWAEDPGTGKWVPTNVNSAIIDGIEFKNKIYLLNDLELDLDYSFLRAKNEKTHRYLVYQPKHKLDCSLKYKDLNGFLFELKGQFTDRRFYDEDNTIYVKRFFVLGLNASKKVGSNVTYLISIGNLLNRKYQVLRDFPMPGFSLTSSVKVEF